LLAKLGSCRPGFNRPSREGPSDFGTCPLRDVTEVWRNSSPAFPPSASAASARLIRSPGSKAGVFSWSELSPQSEVVCHPASWLGPANPRVVVETGSSRSPEATLRGFCCVIFYPHAKPKRASAREHQGGTEGDRRCRAGLRLPRFLAFRVGAVVGTAPEGPGMAVCWQRACLLGEPTSGTPRGSLCLPLALERLVFRVILQPCSPKPGSIKPKNRRL